MTVDIRALLDLFPEPRTHAVINDDAGRVTITGACPYDDCRDAFVPEFLQVIDQVRVDSRWGPIFAGDTNNYDNNHSSADLALCGELARRGLTAGGIDTAMRASGLYREKWERDDYRERTIARALDNRQPQVQAAGSKSLAPKNGRVSISTEAPPPRNWVVDGLLLAKKSAVLAGFGGVSKTQLAIQLAIDVVLGRDFAGKSTKQGGAILLLGEEDREEIGRRVSAVARYHNMTPEQVGQIEANLLAYPFVGVDMRLTKKEGGALEDTNLAEQIVDAAREAGNIRLIVLDHMALLHGGDFNAREDAALTMRVVNHIAETTGAAVLVLAHSRKAAAAEAESDANMVSGSTAFVDQARAALILATMRDEEGKKFDFDREQRMRHVSLVSVKANYGPTGEVSWFERVGFDGVGLLVQAELVPPLPPLKGAERLEQQIIDIIAGERGRYAPTKLREKFSGKKGPLKASKSDVVQAMKNLLDDGRLKVRAPTDDERKVHSLPGQTRDVLDLGDT